MRRPEVLTDARAPESAHSFGSRSGERSVICVCTRPTGRSWTRAMRSYVCSISSVGEDLLSKLSEFGLDRRKRLYDRNAPDPREIVVLRP